MKYRKQERGNALIYVLIAIALFAALSFMMGRQGGDTGQFSGVDETKTDLHTTQILAYSAQVQQVIDQMLFTGGAVPALRFDLPGTAGYNAGSHIHKVYHPLGGGLVPATLPAGSVDQSTADPVPGWYLGSFNNVGWSDTPVDDVILIAYQISQPVCEAINLSLTGSTAIPTLGDSIRNVMIDDASHGGANVDFTAAVCGACDGVAALCVENAAQTAYGFYTIVAQH